MPDKGLSAGPRNSRPDMRHQEPPSGLKRWGRLAVTAVIVVAVLGIGWRWWNGRNAAEAT